MVFRSSPDGVFRGSLRALARDSGISPQHVISNVVPALIKRGLIKRDARGPRVRSEYRFLRHSGQESLPESGQRSLPGVPEFPRRCGQRSWPVVGNGVGQSGQEACPHKEAEQIEAAAASENLSDTEWLTKVVRAKYPTWSVEDLREQWLVHGVKAEQKHRWIKGDREHFLRAWMPEAQKPVKPSSSKPARAIEPPEWWDDFLTERCPNARTREFAVLSKADYFPEMLQEGQRWAEQQRPRAV